MYVAGPASVRNSEFIENTGDWGGGLYVTRVGSFDIWDSLFSKNNASSSGGGIYVEGGGGTLPNSINVNTIPIV